MFATLVSAPFAPFSMAIAVVMGLLALEVVALLLGGSFLVGEGDAADLDGPDIDGPDLDGPDLDGPDLDGPDLDGPDAELDAPAGAGGLASAAAWMGLGRVPFLIWLAALLTSFGTLGYGLQSAAASIVAPLPLILAIPAAVAAAIPVTKIVSGWIGRAVPKTETTATRLRWLAGSHGVVSQGTAAPGRPAEVRVTDRHGNLHFLRVEPAFEEPIPQGTTVYLVRKSGKLAAVPTE